MATPENDLTYAVAGDTSRTRRDVIALVLIVVSVVGMVVCAFVTSPLLGAFAISLLLGVVGVAVGLDSTR